jgi:tetratricopeptide (TPR) repeat protein
LARGLNMYTYIYQPKFFNMISNKLSTINLKMKKSLVFIFSLLISGLGYSQDDKYGATPEIQEECKKNLSLYREFRDQNNFEDAYPYWRLALDLCPASAKTLYLDGEKMIDQKISAASEEEAPLWTDSLLVLLDKRIEHFGEEGFVLGKKGGIQLKNKRYEDAYKTLKKSLEIDGENSSPTTLAFYYNSVYAMFSIKKIDKEQLISDYVPVSEILSLNISREENPKMRESYEKAKQAVDGLFVKVATCEDVEGVAKGIFEKNKTDIEALKKASAMLGAANCDDSDIAFSINSTIQDSEPSLSAARSLGNYSLKNRKFADAKKFFEQAIELNETGSGKAEDYLRLTQALLYLDNYKAAKAMAQRAAAEKSGWGEPYILMGDAIAGSSKSCPGDDFKQKSVYWLAVDYYNKAKSVDPSSAEKANKRIATYSKYYPEKKDVFYQGLGEGDKVEVECWGETSTVRVN